MKEIEAVIGIFFIIWVTGAVIWGTEREDILEGIAWPLVLVIRLIKKLKEVWEE